MKYVAIGNIENVELAGCLDITNTRGNYVTVVNRLELLLALSSSRFHANKIVSSIQAEAKASFLPFHEYVINELQHEFRLANRLKHNEKYENEVLSKWSKTIILRYNVEVAEEFLGLIKTNRANRKR
ncbi:hypothetical protein QTN47_27325 [Danxiaibacter flavus]|uniref:Uncharacterized protein n=1 Tax=Danxiaibacter flavus TaxID=3049108 RepID=A0ABV3ZMZ1_9BACT|nr:hypothetical protein QNM32_27325 [Chitinophagaceae bacterium DXS]